MSVPGYTFSLSGAQLVALGSGALYWPRHNMLCVSDLHLGKSGRQARLLNPALPPYEARDTLARLEADIRATRATSVICLGDSFDDARAADELPETEKLWIASLQAGRQWYWVEGNHDPGPVNLGGTHLAEVDFAPLRFRHIALSGETGEISGHYHPKAKVAGVSRPAFLIDAERVIMPAYGTYTGGLFCDRAPLNALMGAQALAVLTGDVARPVPMPRKEQAR